MNNKAILETLKLQPLTEEEKSRRHILGRWYGPIATCNESTRNGRRYNRELWEKALNDELFHEKIANKCLFLELGHPQDREETDMSKVCACIPEMPKIINGDLCACVDILDTPNGRILKTLCDYGFIPGVSSRGSGDVMSNNDVDPDTFYLETFDCVAIPAVKRARGVMCESLDSTGAKLKRALTESFNRASEEDKAIMKETLENLNIDINEELSEKDTSKVIELFKQGLNGWTWEAWESAGAGDKEDAAAIAIAELYDSMKEQDIYNLFWDWANELTKTDFDNELNEEDATVKLLTADDIPWDPEEEDVLMEDTKEAEETDTEVSADETEEAAEEETTEDESSIETEEEEATNDEETAEEEPAEEDDAPGAPDLETVSDAVEMLQEFDDDMPVEFEPVVIDGKEYEVETLDHFVDDTDEENPVLVIGVNCEPTEEASEITDNNIEPEIEDEEISEEEAPEEEKAEETAEDNGEDEVFESLKEMIRQKEALEAEVSELRKAKSVGDAKEQELQEKLARYRKAFKQTSAEAAKVPELQSTIDGLNEQLTQSKTQIQTLTEKVNNARQLKESIEANKSNEKRLTESVTRLTEANKALEAKLEGQTKQYTRKLQERTDLAKTYKARFLETLNKYVAHRAQLLGVRPSEITSRLNENYTLADVDTVCDQILDTTVNFSRLPFGEMTKASARISESVNRQTKYEEDDLSDLYELAGLKK